MSLEVSNDMKELSPNHKFNTNTFNVASLIHRYVRFGNIEEFTFGLYPSEDGSYVNEMYVSLLT